MKPAALTLALACLLTSPHGHSGPAEPMFHEAGADGFYDPYVSQGRQYAIIDITDAKPQKVPYDLVIGENQTFCFCKRPPIDAPSLDDSAPTDPDKPDPPKPPDPTGWGVAELAEVGENFGPGLQTLYNVQRGDLAFSLKEVVRAPYDDVADITDAVSRGVTAACTDHEDDWQPFTDLLYPEEVQGVSGYDALLTRAAKVLEAG